MPPEHPDTAEDPALAPTPPAAEAPGPAGGEQEAEPEAEWMERMKGITRLRRAKEAAGGEQAWATLSDLQKHEYLKSNHLGRMGGAPE